MASWFVERLGSEVRGRAVSVSTETSTTCTVSCSRSVPGGTRRMDKREEW